MVEVNGVEFARRPLSSFGPTQQREDFEFILGQSRNSASPGVVSAKFFHPENPKTVEHYKKYAEAEAKKDSPNTVWRHPAFRGYVDYMETENFEKGLEELLAVAGQKRTVIMCSEAVWWRCHRSMISDKLKSIGVTVIHIMDGKNVVHPYTSAARLLDRRLIYGDGSVGEDPR